MAQQKANINNPVFVGNVITDSVDGYRIALVPNNNGTNKIQSLLPGTSFVPLELVADQIRYRPAYYGEFDVAHDIWHGGNLPVEQGTWIPAIVGQDTAGYDMSGERYGKYIRQGNLVYITCRISDLNVVSAVGRMAIVNLPFVESFGLTAPLNIGTVFNWDEGFDTTVYIAGNSIYFLTKNNLYLQAENAPNGAWFSISGIYAI